MEGGYSPRGTICWRFFQFGIFQFSVVTFEKLRSARRLLVKSRADLKQQNVGGPMKMQGFLWRCGQISVELGEGQAMWGFSCEGMMPEKGCRFSICGSIRRHDTDCLP